MELPKKVSNGWIKKASNKRYVRMPQTAFLKLMCKFASLEEIK